MPQTKMTFKNSKLFYMYVAVVFLIVGTPEVDLNGYPRMCNPYCRDIQIWKCEWSKGYQMAQTK